MLPDAELQTKSRKYVFEPKGQIFDVTCAGIRALERGTMVSIFRETISDKHLYLTDRKK